MLNPLVDKELTSMSELDRLKIYYKEALEDLHKERLNSARLKRLLKQATVLLNARSNIADDLISEIAQVLEEK